MRNGIKEDYSSRSEMSWFEDDDGPRRVESADDLMAPAMNVIDFLELIQAL